MAKKLISRQQQKPTLKKIKKYSLAGYNLSGVSQAPQASYYLGQSAAEEAGENQNVALQSLKETQDELKKLNEDQKKQQEIVKQSSMELGKLALSTGKDIFAERAAKQAAAAATKTVANTAVKEFGTNAMLAADTGADLASTGASVGANAVNAANTAGSFMSGVSSYGQPVAAALNIGGEIIKNTGSDNDATTFTKKERNRYGVGNIMASVGKGASYGSVAGPYGTLAGAVAGLGYGIYDTIRDNKKSEEEANKLDMAGADQMSAVNNAFINSRMMDTYKGGNQMARHGGMRRYAMGGSDCPPGTTYNPATGACDPVASATPQFNFTTNFTPEVEATGEKASGEMYNSFDEQSAKRQARKDYQQKKQQYNMDWAKARRIDIGTADPRTLQDRIPYPQMPYSPAEQRRVDAGKEPGTFFDYYQKDRTRPGTRMLNNWNNDLMEGDQDLGFKEERPVVTETQTSGGNSGNFFKDLFKEKANYNTKTDNRQRTNAPGQRKQNRDCRKKMSMMGYSGGDDGCYEFGGSYEDLGGTRYAEGGKIKPIPNSNDVAFEGQSHEEGGIKLDKYTEVEGGETATKINGNQYFFSKVLKTDDGGSYAQAHKAVASNPSIDPISKKNIIKGLARKQEVDAGRDPKQIARTGGMQEYAGGGKKKDPPKKKTSKDFTYADMENYDLPIGPMNESMNGFMLNGQLVEYRMDAETGDYIRDPKTNQPVPFPVSKKTDLKVQDGLRQELLDYNYRPQDNINPESIPPEDPRKLDLSKTWLEEHPGVIGGAAQLIGPAYAMLKPYKKTAGMAMPGTVSAPSLARVDKSGEIEDARRQQNAMNTYLKNTNLGPGKIIAMQSVASKTADEIAKISQRQDQENRAIKNAEAQIAAEVAGRNQAAQLEASKSNMMADINQNQYMDERNLGVAEALGKGLAGMSMDQRKLDMQYRIARGLDKTGALNRYEIMEQLRKQAKNPESPVYQKSEAELQQIAADLGYKVVEVLADDKEEKKRLGGMARKYTSRLGDLSTKRNTTAKQSI